MTEETARLLNEVAHEVRAMRSELQFVRQELSSMAGGLAVVVSQAADHKKKLRVSPIMSRASIIALEKLRPPGS